MTTLIIAPHLDDEVLLSGGLIRKRSMNGEFVVVWTAFGRRYSPDRPEWTQAEQDRERLCAINCTNLLAGQFSIPLEGPLLPEGEPGRVGYYDILIPLERALARYKPDEVVIPGRNDLNQDHRHLHDACKIALRPGNLGSVTRILEGMAQDAPLQEPTYGVEMSEKDLDVVLAAYAEYQVEMRGGVHPRSPATIRAHRRVCGSRFGVEYAEPYRLLLQLEPGG